MSDDSRPCDTEPPAEVRHLHTATRRRIARFNEVKVVELAPRRIAKQQTDHDLAHALARAFRSTEAAGKYDDEPEGAA